MAAAIACAALSKRYDGGALGLDGVTLTVPAGAAVALVGQNGAGKSTLLKLVLGLLRPSGGRLTVLGVERVELAHGRIGTCPRARRPSPAWTAAPGSGTSLACPGCPAPRQRPSARWPMSTWRLPLAGGCPATRAGCCSGPRWPRPCWASRSCCCSTSRPAASIPRASGGSGSPSGRGTEPASRSCSPRTTWPRWRCSATPWSSCGRAACSSRRLWPRSATPGPGSRSRSPMGVTAERAAALGLLPLGAEVRDGGLVVPVAAQAAVLGRLLEAGVDIVSLNPVRRSLEEAYLEVTRA